MNKSFLFLGISIVGLSCLGVFSILAIVFKHSDGTNTDQSILQIATILTPTIIALIGAFKSVETEKVVTDKVTDLKTTVESNTEHLGKQAIKVADLNNKVATAKVTAEIAAKAAVVLADKIDKLNGK